MGLISRFVSVGSRKAIPERQSSVERGWGFWLLMLVALLLGLGLLKALLGGEAP